MKIVIDIPKEFESHFEFDRFADSLARVASDIEALGFKMSGRYERETITMIRKAFENGTPLPEGAEILTAEAYSDLCLRASQECKTDTCENIGEESEYDQFVCSKCGIELLDWTRYIGDECYEYMFKFCPNCGCRIVEGAEE